MTKKITLEGVGGVKLSTDAGLDKWLENKKVQCLIDSDGDEVVDFDSLVDGGTYKLGPPQQQQLRDQKPTVTIKLKYKNATIDWEVDTSDENLTLEALTAAARRLFHIKVAKLQFVRNGNEINKDSDVAGLRDGSLVRVENNQIPFSSVKQIPQAMALVGLKSSLEEKEDAFPAATKLNDSDEYVKQAIETINRLQKLVPIVGGCGATRRLYIDPILCAAGLTVGETTMTVEKQIEDAQFSGDVDYLLSFNDVVICVTEGKKDQLDYGIAQNIAQLASVRANRKRKFDEMSKPAVFGIATTFHEWVFIECSDNYAHRTKPIIVDPQKSTTITTVIERITGLLQKCKRDAKEL